MKTRHSGNSIRTRVAASRCDVRLTGLSLAMAAALIHVPAFAQQPTPASEGEQPKPPLPAGTSPKPEVQQEIVITAEKRGSTVQKTAISITAVSGEDLQERGISSAKELARETPGVAVKSSGPGQTEFTIRGLSSSAGVSPTVGVYLDEFPVSPPTLASAGKVGIDPDLYDLARVEILRGPQGTLYGASSMGGTLKLVPAAPKLNGREGSIQVIGSGTQGGGTNGSVNAMLNVPLVQNELAMRVVLTAKHNSGWIDRVVEPNFPLPDTSETGSLYSAPRGDVLNTPASKVYRNANTEDLAGVRASLLYKPTSDLTITPSVFYQQIRQGGPDTYDASPGTNAHYQPFDIAEPYRDRFGIASLKVNYEFETASLTSATAYIKRNRRQTQDSSEILLKSLGDAFGLSAYDAADGGFGSSAIVEAGPTRQFTQELRLASKEAGPWKWIAGVFYSQIDSSYLAELTAPDGGAVAGTTNIYTASLSDKLVQAAVFGNVSYEVNPSLKVTGGLRYFTSKDTATNSDSGLFSSGVGETTSTDASGFNPMVNVAYTVSKDSMLYVTAAKGFRDGAAQHGVPSACADDLAALGLTESPKRYGPDTVWSYELGSKNRMLGGALTVNAAAYYMKWSRVQQNVLLPTCGFVYTDNAADAIVKGFELEAAARLAPGLTLEQSVGYSRARFSTDNASSATKAGDKLLNVPEWTASSSLRYAQAINDDYGFVGRLGVVYVGSQDALTAQRTTLPSYTLVGLRGGIEADTWSTTLFVDNLTNRKVALNNTQSLTINTPSLDRVSTNRPRTIGIEFAQRF